MNIDEKHFESMHSLKFIYFIKFRYCQYASHVRVCRPLTDGLSSEKHLLVYPFLRMSIWFVTLATCVGNSIVLIWRSVSTKEDQILSLFIKNLAVADLLMGIYLCIIGAHDLAFRDKFRHNALKWTSSWSCTFSGFLAMLSSELSVMILALITVERYRCITSNLRVVTERGAKINLIMVWLFSFAIAFAPIVYYAKTGDRVFYASNGLCFPLHIDEPYQPGWEYSAFVFFGINFTAVLLILALYLRMFLIIRHDRKFARPAFAGKKREDAVLALRFFFIVLTDCLCWTPIVAIKLLALMGTNISCKTFIQCCSMPFSN